MSGEEALHLMQEKHVDIVITDIVMPGMDGLTLLKHIAAWYPNVCVILMSGLRDFESARQGLILGAHDYLIKPVSGEQFEATMLRTMSKITVAKEQRIFMQENENIIDCLCERIRCEKVLSKDAEILFLRAIQRGTGRQDTITYLDTVQVVSLLTIRLFQHFTCKSMRDLPGTIVGRHWHHQDLEIRCHVILGAVQCIYRELLLPEVQNRMVRDVIRLAFGVDGVQISVESIARRLFINRSHLSLLFSRECGLSLSKYLVRVKIFRAHILLIRDEWTIAEVAHFVGYQDEKHFSRIFKAHGGYLPREYRNFFFGDVHGGEFKEI